MIESQRVCVRTKFRGERWTKTFRDPAAQRRHWKARHGSAG